MCRKTLRESPCRFTHFSWKLTNDESQLSETTGVSHDLDIGGGNAFEQPMLRESGWGGAEGDDEPAEHCKAGDLERAESAPEEERKVLERNFPTKRVLHVTGPLCRFREAPFKLQAGPLRGLRKEGIDPARCLPSCGSLALPRRLPGRQRGGHLYPNPLLVHLREFPQAAICVEEGIQPVEPFLVVAAHTDRQERAGHFPFDLQVFVAL